MTDTKSFRSGYVWDEIFFILLKPSKTYSWSSLWSRAIHGGAYFSALSGRKFNLTTVLRPCRPLACYCLSFFPPSVTFVLDFNDLPSPRGLTRYFQVAHHECKVKMDQIWLAWCWPKLQWFNDEDMDGLDVLDDFKVPNINTSSPCWSTSSGEEGRVCQIEMDVIR